MKEEDKKFYVLSKDFGELIRCSDGFCWKCNKKRTNCIGKLELGTNAFIEGNPLLADCA